MICQFENSHLTQDSLVSFKIIVYDYRLILDSNTVLVCLFSFFDRPAVSRGSKAPPKVRQLDRQRDSGKKRRNQPIQVIQIDLLTKRLFHSSPSHLKKKIQEGTNDILTLRREGLIYTN